MKDEKILKALQLIVFYDGLDVFLNILKKQLKETEGYLICPVAHNEWGTEEHTFWEILVCLFGDYGTSIRGGWIVDKEGCCKFIDKLMEKCNE